MSVSHCVFVLHGDTKTSPPPPSNEQRLSSRIQNTDAGWMFAFVKVATEIKTEEIPTVIVYTESPSGRLLCRNLEGIPQSFEELHFHLNTWGRHFFFFFYPLLRLPVRCRPVTPAFPLLVEIRKKKKESELKKCEKCAVALLVWKEVEC